MAGALGRPPAAHPNTKIISVAVSQRIFDLIERTARTRSRSEQIRGLLLDGLRFRKAQAKKTKDLEIHDASETGETLDFEEVMRSAASTTISTLVNSDWELVGEIDGRQVFVGAKRNTPEDLKELITYRDLAWLDDFIEEDDSD